MKILRKIVEIFSWAFIDFIYWPLHQSFGKYEKASKWFLRELEENIDNFTKFSFLSKEFEKMRNLSLKYFVPVFDSKGNLFAMRRQKFFNWLLNDNKNSFEPLKTKLTYSKIYPTFQVTKDASDTQTFETAKKLREELSSFIINVLALSGTKVNIDLDGAFGCSAKFLQELFGNLVQELPYSVSTLQKHLYVKCNDEPSLEKKVMNLICFNRND